MKAQLYLHNPNYPWRYKIASSPLITFPPPSARYRNGVAKAAEAAIRQRPQVRQGQGVARP